MIPGEIIPAAGEIVLNKDRTAISFRVANTGERPIQVGSHYHFAETNAALAFDRQAALGYRLDITARTVPHPVMAAAGGAVQGGSGSGAGVNGGGNIYYVVTGIHAALG